MISFPEKKAKQTSRGLRNHQPLFIPKTAWLKWNVSCGRPKAAIGSGKQDSSEEDRGLGARENRLAGNTKAKLSENQKSGMFLKLKTF